jgi:hypothetical protein
VKLSASDQPTGVELKGTLMASHTFEKIIIERQAANGSFSSIASLPARDNTNLFSFIYLDNTASIGTNFYRIRLMSSIHSVQEISSTIMIRRNEKEISGVKLLNTMVRSGNPVITLSSPHDDEATLEIFDLNGQKVAASKISLNEGNTQCFLHDLTGRQGYFVIVARTARNNTLQQKILIQTQNN